jgi:hypothetical protein
MITTHTTKESYYIPIYVHVSALSWRFYTKILCISCLPLQNSFISKEIIITAYKRKVQLMKWPQYKGLLQNCFVKNKL